MHSLSGLILLYSISGLFSIIVALSFAGMYFVMYFTKSVLPVPGAPHTIMLKCAFTALTKNEWILSSQHHFLIVFLLFLLFIIFVLSNTYLYCYIFNMIFFRFLNTDLSIRKKIGTKFRFLITLLRKTSLSSLFV